MPAFHQLAHVRDSFWFVPTVMATLSALAAVTTTRLDAQIERGMLSSFGWLWVGSAEGARSVLSVIGGTTMTVAGVVFSITVTALAQTSAHFGPRVLRNFTSDRGNQLVLGTFIATFVYCLLVLRSVSTAGESTPPSVPYLSVNVGLALAVASIGVLIYFIHHIVRSLQVEVLLAGIGREFHAGIESLFPAQLGAAAHDDGSALLAEAHWRAAATVCAGEAGYVQRIDQQQLGRLLRDTDLMLQLLKRPGDFVAPGAALLRVRGAPGVDARLRSRLRDCVTIGAFRTPEEDASYSLQQLVEVAARALSPGVNEVFTALSSIDWLVSGLEDAARRQLPAAVRADDGGRPRIVAPPMTFGDLGATALDTLRPYAASNAAVAVRLLQAIERFARAVHRRADQQVLAAQCAALLSTTRALRNPADVARVRQQAKRTRAAIDHARRRIGATAKAA